MKNCGIENDQRN